VSNPRSLRVEDVKRHVWKVRVIPWGMPGREPISRVRTRAYLTILLYLPLCLIGAHRMLLSPRF
jgi:hypothetical protein